MAPTQSSSNKQVYLRLFSDAWAISCCLLIVYFSQYAGIADAIYGYLYVAIILGHRFLKLKRPFSPTQALLHMAASVSIISAFDKIAGYPDDSLNEIPVFLASAVVLLLSATFAYRSKAWLPLLALLILFSDAIVLPLELTKNVVARFVFEEIPPVYVTKIDPPHIYGVSLYDKEKIARFTDFDGKYQPDFYTCCIEALGSGTMDHQEAKFPFQAYQIMRLLYARQKVPGRDPSVDSAKDNELAKTLEGNFTSFESLRQSLLQDADERNLRYIFLGSKGDLRVLCSCNRYKSCTERCALPNERKTDADNLARLAVTSVEIDQIEHMIYFVTDTIRYPHQLFARKRGLAYSPYPVSQRMQSDQELIPVRDGWYVFDRRI